MIERMFVAALAFVCERLFGVRRRSRRPPAHCDPENRNGVVGDRGDQGARSRQGRESGHRDDRACFHRGWQDRARGRRRRHDRCGLALGGARTSARRQAPVHALFERARRGDGAEGFAGPCGRRSRRPVDRRRRRADRQELAHVAGGGARRRGSTSPRTRGRHTARRRSSPRSLPRARPTTALEFWNFCADLEGRGFRRAIEMADVEKALGASGPVAMTGYVFSESFAASHKDALRRFFAATTEARKILREDPSAWAPIKARLRLKDDAALAVYRQRYLEGVPKRTVAEEAADARILYRRLAEVGGRSWSARPRNSTPASSTIPRRANRA